MNFVDGARLGETAKTVGVRPEHISVSDKAGDWKGTVVHAEHLGPDTNLYLDTEKAGLITVRIFGVYNAEPGVDAVRDARPAESVSLRCRGEDDTCERVGVARAKPTRQSPYGTQTFFTSMARRRK